METDASIIKLEYEFLSFDVDTKKIRYKLIKKGASEFSLLKGYIFVNNKIGCKNK